MLCMRAHIPDMFVRFLSICGSPACNFALPLGECDIFQQLWVVPMISGAFADTTKFSITPFTSLHVSDASEWCSCTIFMQFCASPGEHGIPARIQVSDGAVWNVMHVCADAQCAGAAFELICFVCTWLCAATRYVWPFRVCCTSTDDFMCVYIHIHVPSNAIWFSACVRHACTAPGLDLVMSPWVQQASCTFSWFFDMYWWFSFRLQSCPCHCEYLECPCAYLMHPSSFQGHACTVTVAHCCGLASPKPNFRVSTPIWT